MSFDYAQRGLVKTPGMNGFGAVLSNAFAQQLGVPGWRPTTTGEDPQAAAGTPYWQAPGTVGGTMRAQHAKTGAVSGVADYIQMGQAAEGGDWTSVVRNLLQTTTQMATSAQLAQINRERIKAGLPPLTPGARGAPTPTRAKAFGMGTLAVVGLGALAVWALMRRKKRRTNPCGRRRRNPGSTYGRGRPLPPAVVKAKRKIAQKRKKELAQKREKREREWHKQRKAAKRRVKVSKMRVQPRHRRARR